MRNEEWLTEGSALAAMAEYERERAKEAACGPLLSGVLHVALILLLCWLVVPREQPVEEATPVTFNEPPREIEPRRPEPKKQEKLQKLKAEAPPAAALAMPTAAPTPDAPTPDETLTEPLPTAVETDLVAVADFVNRPTNLQLPGLYDGRSPDGRSDGVKDGEGTEAGQDAVLRALRWLARVQRSDGSWEGLPAPSGLALLCFLAHGETPLAEEFGDTVLRGIQWLATNMPEGKAWGAGDRHVAYAHAIATYALAEAYGMTGIPLLTEPLGSGIDVIVAGQQPGGGFDYNYRRGGRWDVSVTGWQMQAMIAANATGITHPDLRPAIGKAAAFLEKTAYQDGRFGYTAQGRESGSRSMTGIATVGLQMSGRGGAGPAMAGAQGVMAGKLATWQQAAGDWPETAARHLYGWYYDTQAVYHHTHGKGPDWSSWNRAFESTLVAQQHPDGFWTHSERHGMGGDHLQGKVLATAFCCLQLEVYYRHLIGGIHASSPAKSSNRLAPAAPVSGLIIR